MVKLYVYGYALALSNVANYVGLETEVVTSEVHISEGQGGEHAWSKVKIDDKWFYADLTWDYKHLEQLQYCLKSPFDKDFRKYHDMITDDIELLARGGKSEIVQELEDELDIYENIKVQSGRTEEEEKELYAKAGYATESYNPEILRQTMQRVNSWAELDTALSRIEALKRNGRASFNLSDINNAISAVDRENYSSVQQVLKQEQRENKEYDQTK